MPVRDVLVGNARGDVKHDNAALPINVVTISQTAKLLLPCGIPDVEIDLAEVLMKGQRSRIKVRL